MKHCKPEYRNLKFGIQNAEVQKPERLLNRSHKELRLENCNTS